MREQLTSTTNLIQFIGCDISLVDQAVNMILLWYPFQEYANEFSWNHDVTILARQFSISHYLHANIVANTLTCNMYIGTFCSIVASIIFKSTK